MIDEENEDIINEDEQSHESGEDDDMTSLNTKGRAHQNGFKVPQDFHQAKKAATRMVADYFANLKQ